MKFSEAATEYRCVTVAGNNEKKKRMPLHYALFT